MTNLLISFRSLAKSNNGVFKSEKQAAFLLSQCDASKAYRQSECYTVHFGDDGKKNQRYDVLVQCDSIGVVSITNIGRSKNKVVFERKSEEAYNANLAIRKAEQAEYDAMIAAATAKQIVRLERMKNRVIRCIAWLKSTEQKETSRKLRMHQLSFVYRMSDAQKYIDTFK